MKHSRKNNTFVKKSKKVVDQQINSQKTAGSFVDNKIYPIFALQINTTSSY